METSVQSCSLKFDLCLDKGNAVEPPITILLKAMAVLEIPRIVRVFWQLKRKQPFTPTDFWFRDKISRLART